MLHKKTVLFICVQNSARSQIAEGFFKKYAKQNMICSSAGTVPADKLNPDAVTTMKEIGIDVSAHKPKVLTNEMIDQASMIINMGCMDNDSCPAMLLKSKTMEDWSIEDPARKPIEKVREIRDQIERKVMDLVLRLSES
jgi:protein-tyrosine-phosphatase